MRDAVERRISEGFLQKAVLPRKVNVVRNLGGGAFEGGRRLYVVTEQSNTSRVGDTDQLEVYGCDERIPCRVSNSERYRTGAEWDRRIRSQEKYASFLVARVPVSDDLTDGGSRTEVP